VNVLDGLIGANLVELNQTIKLRQSQGINAALPVILSDGAKKELLTFKTNSITCYPLWQATLKLMRKP
jgi:CHASE3 domain sensor protein